MAKTRPVETLRPSVFDRLIDEDPDRRQLDPAKPRSQLVRELCASVSRDLSRLLNTRSYHRPLPEALEELTPSCLDYGIPDFTGADLSSANARDELRRRIEEAIRLYEPRFDRVNVRLFDNTEPKDRTLRLRIDALLRADTVLEPIVFDSVVEPVSGGVEVQGQFDE
jgi:type VI secretion system protein ImpF